MNNDLISRSDLKKALEIEQYNDYDDLLRTEHLIDNAPTVEERPQGEWIDTGVIWTETDNGFEAWGTSYKCSECGNLVREKKPFCDVCGADMRKEGEQND